MQASQGSSYPWWLLAVAKRNLLLRECVGRWWQPSGYIGIMLDPIGAQLVTICSAMWAATDKPCY